MVLKDYTSDEEDSKMQSGGAINSSEKSEGINQELPRNSIRAHALNRLRKLLTIVLKLAKVQGYNDNYQIKGQDGNYIERTDLQSLLNWAVSQDKVMVGLNEFVDLLKKAGVTPEDVLNENLKVRLGGGNYKTIQNESGAKPIVYAEKAPPIPSTAKDAINEDDQGPFQEDFADIPIETFRKANPVIKNAAETFQPPPKEAVAGRLRTLRSRKTPYHGPIAELSDSD